MALAVTLALVERAHADPTFPYFFEQAGLPEPPCTICHRSNEGGKGTVVKPFGVTMQRLGLTKDATSGDVAAAIHESETRNLDTDFDGVGDIAELREGGDPNTNPDGGPSNELTGLPLPQTGCTVAIRSASRSSDDAGVAIALGHLALLAGFFSRNRRGASDSRNASAGAHCAPRARRS
jgi:hypothetical protein